MKEYVQVITTTDSKENADKIAYELVKSRLAACVQIIGPIESIYWWKEKVEKTEEWLCIAKTRRGLYEAVELTIHHNHSYEVPEILSVPIVEADSSYILWLSKELRKQS